MSKEVSVPHVVSHDSGAHDRAKPLGVRSGKGHFSGRPHPPTRSAASGGDPYGDYAAGAVNEGGSGTAAVDELEAAQPASDSEQVFVPGSADAGSPAHRRFVAGVTGSEADRQHAGGYKKGRNNG